MLCGMVKCWNKHYFLQVNRQSQTTIASPELRDNKEIVELACKNWPHAMKYASDALKDDKKFILRILQVEGSGILLKYLSENMIGDKTVVYAAVRSCKECYFVFLFLFLFKAAMQVEEHSGMQAMT